MSVLIDQLKKIAKSQVPMQCYLCTVKEVDKGKTITAEPLNGEAEMLEVRLRSVDDNQDTGIIINPAKGSHVLVGIIHNDVNQAFVVAFGEVESFTVKIDGQTLEADKDGWVYNGGNNHGIVNIVPLVNKINTIENDLNILKGLIAGWVIAPADGGAALKTALTPWLQQTITPTQVTDLEDPTIKH